MFTRSFIVSSIFILAFHAGTASSESAPKKSSPAKSAVKTLQNSNTSSDTSLRPQGVDPALVVTPQNDSTPTGVGSNGGSGGGGTGGTDTSNQQGTGSGTGNTGVGTGGTDTSGQRGTGSSGGSTGGGSGQTVDPNPVPVPSVQ